MRFSLRRLRTTPAKKPRTECRCQPVACMIAAIVAPFGDESRAMTRDCFEPGFNVSAFRLRTAFCPDRPAVAAGFDWAGTWRVPLDSAVLGVDLAAERDARLTARFFADFDIEILHSVRGWRRTTEAPSRRSSRRGRISKRFRRLRVDDSTAPFAAEVQSLLAKTQRGESHVDGALKNSGIWGTPVLVHPTLLIR